MLFDLTLLSVAIPYQKRAQRPDLICRIGLRVCLCICSIHWMHCVEMGWRYVNIGVFLLLRQPPLQHPSNDHPSHWVGRPRTECADPIFCCEISRRVCVCVCDCVHVVLCLLPIVYGLERHRRQPHDDDQMHTQEGINISRDCRRHACEAIVMHRISNEGCSRINHIICVHYIRCDRGNGLFTDTVTVRCD